jgi:arabinogalactan endo-1,4-beta-galactosidase
MFEKKIKLRNAEYLLRVEIKGPGKELSGACVELSPDGDHWLTAALLPQTGEESYSAIVPVHAKVRQVRLVSESAPFGPECEIKATAGQPGEFINGADVSHLMQLEDFGGRFFNRDGVEQDCLRILKDHGVNSIRLKVWNKPGLPDNDPAGYNDCAHVLKMAKRVKDMGFTLLIDFHYSDWWTDPGKQFMPQEWKELSFPQLEKALYDFTYKLIHDLKRQGSMPEMVQIGNEITNGMLWDVARLGGEFDTDEQWDKLCALLKSGLAAVKAVDPSIRTIVHIERGADNDRSVYFFDKLREKGICFDDIGLSYYSLWHGPMENYKKNINDLAVRYGKNILIVETAYPYTAEDGDDTPNASKNPGCSLLPGYPATLQGQASNFHTVLSILKDLPDNRGTGCFYWEPAFIPVKGAGWKYGEGSEWDDQTLFDFDGRALWTLEVFRMHGR